MRAVMAPTLLVSLLACAEALGATAGVFTTDQQPPVIAVTDDLDMKANSHLFYFVDEPNSLTIDELLGAEPKWVHSDSDNIAFGLQTSTIWLKLRLRNSGTEASDVFLEFNPVFLEKIVAYDSSGQPLHETGSAVSTNDMESFPTIRLSVPPGEVVRYISIKSRANSLATVIRSASAHQVKSTYDLAVFCVLIGGLLFLMLYHVFLFVTYRNWTYLFYSLFVASTILFTATFTSYHKILLPPALLGVQVDFWWSALSAPILFICMYLFSAELLGLFPKKPYFSRANLLQISLLVLPIVEILIVAGILITNDPAILIPVRFSALVHMLVLPTVGVVLWFRNRSNVINLYYAFSWLPFTAGSFLIVAWLSGAVPHSYIYSWSLPIGALFQSLLLSFAAGQQLNVVTKDKIREQKDKLRVMDELKVQVENLKKRDRVITTFVSPEVVEELDRGDDPLMYEPRNVQKSIVFLDMHDYTTFFETNSPFECHEVLNHYFKIINDSTYSGGGSVDKIIGDAVMMVFDDPTLCLQSIVKLRKNLSAVNRQRVSENKKPLKFGVGATYGTMLSANFGSSYKFDRTLIGDTVNVASRLETITRQFAVDVLCSKEFIDLHRDYPFFRPAGYVLLKGRTRKSLVYELFEHNLPQVVEWKLSTKPYIEEAIQLELEGKYVEALTVIRSLVDRCPPHSFKTGAIMDQTLLAMEGAIGEKMRQLELRVPSKEELQDATAHLKKAS